MGATIRWGENSDLILSLGAKRTIIKGLTCLDKHGHFTVTKGNESHYVEPDLLNSLLATVRLNVSRVPH